MIFYYTFSFYPHDLCIVFFFAEVLILYIYNITKILVSNYTEIFNVFFCNPHYYICNILINIKYK